MNKNIDKATTDVPKPKSIETTTNNLLVDAHVHAYGNYPPDDFFKQALENFVKTIADHKIKNPICVLLFTETCNDSAFKQLSDGDIDDFLPDWQIQKTGDDHLLKFSYLEHHYPIWVVSGRQFVSEENVEVLVWNYSNTDLERLPANDVIEKALAAKAFVGLPWGVGKWFGKRGQIISELMESHQDNVFVVDNAGRPKIWGTPKHFHKAMKMNIPILVGSDPLPVDNGYRKVGLCGTYVKEAGLKHASVAELFKALKTKQGESYGYLEKVGQFIKDQVAMQKRKRQ